MNHNAPSDNDKVEHEQPFMAHLIELRDRLLRAVALILVIFLSLFYFANDLYTVLAEPLLRHMPEGSSMIATQVASPFLTPFKLVMVLSIFIAMPYILYQGWAFIAPGLYKHERKLVFPLMLSSALLFYAGMAFAYYVVFPLAFGFFASVSPEGVEISTDISAYLDFVLKLFFAFGIAFEIPIATIILVWTEMTTPESLIEKRPYIVVGAFVFGMLLTPPDVISQTLLALPMLLLFEFGVFFSRYFLKMKKERQEEEDAAFERELNGDPESRADSEESDQEQGAVDMEEELDRYERDEAALDEELDSWEEEKPQKP
jgi:sec-independent protein translocase protein TatC